MFMKRGAVYLRNSLVILAALVLVSALTLFTFGTEPIPTGYAVADCVDLDGDGYYDEGCLADDLSCGVEVQVIDDAFDQSNLDVYGNKLVYEDNSNGNQDVFQLDLDTDTLTQLSTSLEADINPRIEGDYVVWQSYEGGDWNIVIFDGVSSTTINTDGDHQVTPDVSGDWVVWSDNRDGVWSIYAHDLAGSFGNEQIFVSGTANLSNPKISGDHVVFTSEEDGNTDVYHYNIATTDLTQITSSSAKENAPETDGEFIVWQTDEQGNWDVYLYDISDGSTEVVADGDGDQRLPYIEDNTIVWMDDAAGNFDIQYKDLDQSLEVLVTTETSDQLVPVIYQNEVYWLDDRSSVTNIWSSIIGDECGALLGDCDDTNLSINPGQTELCLDLVDNNCDGLIDNDCDINSTTNSTSNSTVTNSTNSTTNSTTIILDDTVDCDAMWDCSAVDYGECTDGVATRDLTDCVHPDPDLYPECWEDTYLPEESISCVEDDSSDDRSSSSDSTTTTTNSEDLPFFTWVNVLIMIFILIGYYAFRKES